jgi:hypothetical protein
LWFFVIPGSNATKQSGFFAASGLLRLRLQKLFSSDKL